MKDLYPCQIAFANNLVCNIGKVQMIISSENLAHREILEDWVLDACERNCKYLQKYDVKTLLEWSESSGIRILDYYGFNRSDPFLFERLFTREEYMAGVMRCTITDIKDTSFN